MSREAEIINQIAQGEGQQQEFKRLIDNTERIDDIVALLIRLAQSAGELHYDESPVRGAGLPALSEQAFGSYYERQFGLPL